MSRRRNRSNEPAVEAKNPGLPAEASRPSGRRWKAPAAVLIPMVVILLLEGGLRLFGYGSTYPLFVSVPGFPDYQLPNPDVAQRYFARTRSLPRPAHDAFLTGKPAGTIRLFVQGGSSAAGFPYAHGASLSRILRQRVNQQLPQTHVEVVSTAMEAVSSTVLADLVNEIIEQQPDAVLVYAGPDEFYGAFGVASSEGVSSSAALARIYLALDELRLVQLVRNAAARMQRPVHAGDSGDSTTRMEELGRDRHVGAGSDLRQAGLDRFRSNLTRMACSYRDAGIPVFLGTVVSNEKGLAPLVSRLAASTDSSAWDEARKVVSAAVSAGDLETALAASKAVLDMDSTSAIVRFGHARLLERAGRFEDALVHYQAAIDYDAVPFRAPSAVNAIIRDVALACGSELVDVRAALASAVPGGIIGHDLILEHVHPNVDGYFLLAETFYRSLEKAGVLPPPEGRVPLAAARLEVHVTQLDSTLAALQVRRLLNHWPFQRTPASDTFQVVTPIDRWAVEVSQGTRSWEDATQRLGALYEQNGDFPRALVVALTLVQEYPYRGAPLVMAGTMLERMGRLQDALRFFLAASAREPSVESLRMSGQLIARLGRPQDALEPLDRALAMRPEDPEVLYDLGMAYLALGRASDALGAAQRILAVEPSHPGALRLYQSALGGGMPPGGG